jgi:diguanylate cyclase (GGDEF)-like protein
MVTPLRLLVIEDNPADLALIRHQLADAGQAGWQIEHVSRVRDASAHLASGSVDIVLLDLNLPDAMGLDGLAAVRAVDHDVPVVVLTGSNDETLALAALKQGAQDFLVKGEATGRWLSRAITFAGERHRFQRELRELALCDELTGLYNRRGFRLLAERECKALERSDGAILLVAVDLDHLKSINDTHGHAAGDGAIRLVGEALRHALRQTDILARVGGDEFLCLARHAAPTERAAVFERVRRVLAWLVDETSLDYPVTVSLGAAFCRGPRVIALDDRFTRRTVSCIDPNRRDRSSRRPQAPPTPRLPGTAHGNDSHGGRAMHVSGTTTVSLAHNTGIAAGALADVATRQRRCTRPDAESRASIDDPRVAGSQAIRWGGAGPRQRVDGEAPTLLGSDPGPHSEGRSDVNLASVRRSARFVLGEEPSAGARPRRKALRILIVEDEPGARRFTQDSLLETLGNRLEIRFADRLETAIAETAGEEWDVVLLDLGLPDSWGLDTFRRFRTTAPEVPVIVLTGVASEELGLEALREGAQDYLVKGTFDGSLLGRAALYAIERSRLEARLRNAEKMEAVGTLAGGIAHDFNNLLSAILGYEEFVRAALPPDSPARSDLIEIRRAAETASALTRQLMSFARKESSQHEPVDVNQVLVRLEPLLRRLLPDEITFRMLRAADASWTTGNSVELQQVVINLAVNARDAMPAGGTLTISTRDVHIPERTGSLEAGRYVALTVDDTGCGMDSRTLSRLFEPFFTTKERDRGTGLGLASVFAIVKRCGGGILVTSEVGQGTTMEIYLPAGA